MPLIGAVVRRSMLQRPNLVKGAPEGCEGILRERERERETEHRREKAGEGGREGGRGPQSVNTKLSRNPIGAQKHNTARVIICRLCHHM